MRLSRKVTDHLKELVRGAAEAPPRSTAIDSRAAGSVGPYEVLAVIGAGGMGTVYRAVDRATGREVALKIPHADTALINDRFERESWFARALGRHGDAPYLDHGVTSLGTPFLAMPLLEGRSLAEQLAEHGTLEPAEALRVGERVAHVLATLHARKLIHRDVKPANVLLDDDGGVWLVDLGLTGSPHTALPGAGTPAYAAPEQIAGASVAANADVFALGRVLIEALTGKRGAVADVQPVELRALLTRMLAERADDRPADGAVVAAALARIRTIGDLAGGAQSWRTRGVLDMPFVGRESELARLSQQLGSQRHAWISGPPGIGKAALVLAWWDGYAPIDATLAWAATHDGRSPLGLARRWVDAAAGLRGGERREVRMRALAELARAVDHAAIAREVQTGSTLDEAQLQALLEATAAERSLVLVNHDGRRADPQSVALLRNLEARLGPKLVIIHLDDEPHPDSALPPLPSEAMRRLAEHAPEGASIDHALATASGNPLALQLLLLESGNSLEDAIARRIQRLDPYARWLLRLGSVAGLAFRAATLLAVVGACDGPALRDGLGRLAEARLLVDLTRELGAEAGSYRFRHALFARIARGAWSANRQALGRRLLQD